MNNKFKQVPEKAVDPLAYKDSGERIEWGHGVLKDPPTGRGRFDLIGTVGLERLAKRYEVGAIKYGDRNWEKGAPASECISSLLRHINQWLAGDDEEDHLAAAAFWAFAVMEFERKKPDMIDVDSRQGKNVF